MTGVHRAYMLAYSGLVGLVMAADLTAAQAGNAGLLAPTVCISPAVFLISAALPIETLTAVTLQRLGMHAEAEQASDGGGDES